MEVASCARCGASNAPTQCFCGHLGYLAFHGRALDVLGRALLEAGDPAGAAQALSEAAAVFDNCGAGWGRETAERVLEGVRR